MAFYMVSTPAKRKGGLHIGLVKLSSWSMQILLALVLWVAAATIPARAAPLELVVLGDSLSSGYGLSPTEGFAVVLEKALRDEGLDIRIVNAGVAGDTSTQGLARLDWSVPEGTRGVIVELGANDALRGQDPAQTEKAMDEILTRLKARNIPILLAGMLAPPNMGQDYEARFNPIFPKLADKHGVLFYPFFLENVAGNLELNQPDGMHPNAQGVQKIVKGILPLVKTLAEKAR
jgi:acyl-CoA thioesterase I